MHPRHRTDAAFLKVWLGLVMAFLFVPLGMVIVQSFNASPYGAMPFEFTTSWYSRLFSQRALIDATLLDLQLSLVVAALAAILGSLLAAWMVRVPRKLAFPINAVLISAVTVPWLLLGVGMLIVLQTIGLGRSQLSMVLGCLAVSLPYVVFVVVATLQTLDPLLDDAARSLGATPRRAALRVTVPLAAPAIVSGALMAFIVSFNNFVIQYFLAPLGVRTLPLEIYSNIRNGYTPDINALGTLLVVVSVALVILLQSVSGNASGLVGGARPSSRES